MSPEGVGGGGGMQGVTDEFIITATANGIPATHAPCCAYVHHSVRKRIRLQEVAGMSPIQ